MSFYPTLITISKQHRSNTVTISSSISLNLPQAFDFTAHYTQSKIINESSAVFLVQYTLIEFSIQQNRPNPTFSEKRAIFLAPTYIMPTLRGETLTESLDS